MAEKLMELRFAVQERNLEKVRFLLHNGAKAGDKDGSGITHLHIVDSAEIAKELIMNGAYINATNCFGDTPLHRAAVLRKFEVLKVLLEHGASVDYTDWDRNTPLNNACMQSGIGRKVVRELLEYGADINIRNEETWNSRNHHTPLENSIKKINVAKLLIKIFLLKKIDTDFKTAIDIKCYSESKRYKELSQYLEDCVCEIIQMKTDKFNDSFPINKFIAIRNVKMKTLSGCNKIIPDDIVFKYPIYHDIIWAYKIFLKTLKELVIYMVPENSSNKIFLNNDCTLRIVKNVPGEDLESLLCAFDSNVEKIDEDSGSSA